MNGPLWTIRPRMLMRGYRKWLQICSLRDRSKFIFMNKRRKKSPT